MQKDKLSSCVVFLIAAVLLFRGLTEAAEVSVRQSKWADSFYPADQGDLQAAIQRFLENVPAKEIQGEIAGFIVPHAGYIYSGQTAAHAYKKISGRALDTVILIGPSHRIPFDGISIWREGPWQSPLGSVAVDLDLAKAIAGEDSRFQFGPGPHLEEHSLEVQIPFLQTALQNFKIVPILFGNVSVETSRKLAQAIVKHQKGKRVLLVASSDMSHYHSAEKGGKIDARTLELIKKGDSAGLYSNLSHEQSELCGAGAVLALLEFVRLKEGLEIELLNYAHSGHVSGDLSRVVGYSSFVIYEKTSRGTQEDLDRKASASEAGEQNQPQFNPSQRQTLLKIARQSLEAHLFGRESPKFFIEDKSLLENKGLFVTLTKKGELRGCVGHIVSSDPLLRAVQDTAILAATRDARFKPVAPEELKDLDIEISILTSPEKVDSIEKIELGRHGVILQKGEASGVFLPKVAEKTGWDKETFLRELCTQKAGLKEDCWEDPSVEIYRFTSEDFSERHE